MTRLNVRNAALAIVLAVLAFAGAGTAIANSAATPAQPHMDSALTYLHQALQELNAATADKGGHRNQAIKAVEEAINQTKAGMNAAP
jgi:hypothetical protein